MSDILHREICIKLNKHWVAYEHLTVKDAITFLCSQSKDGPTKGQPPGFAMDFLTEPDENGHHQFISAPVPVLWDDWIDLEVRSGDLHVNAARGKRIRVPLVVICANYDDLPTKKVQWSPEAVRKRDGGICQVSRRLLGPGEGNVGHDEAQSINPQRRRDWTNTIWMDKQLNTLQGTKTFAQMGWKPIRKPEAPKERVKVLTAADVRHPSQRPFLI